MALKSHQQYLSEMAAGMMSKVPIVFDEDDLAFLMQFPLEMWNLALKWRYNDGLRQSVEEMNQSGSPNNNRTVFLNSTYKLKRVGNVPGFYEFKGIQTDQGKLLKKLGDKPPYAQISNMGPEERRSHGPVGYDYDVSKVYKHDDPSNPNHFLEGMPVMQKDVATNALSTWIKANHHGIFGEAPQTYGGQQVQKRPIKKYQYAKEGMEMSSIVKQFSGIKFWPNRKKMDDKLLTKFDAAYPEKSVELPKWEEALPVLLPGRYIPYLPKYEKIKKKPGGVTSMWLMNNIDQLTDKEREHFSSSHLGPIDHMANHESVRNGRFYVVGGWTPTAQQKGIHQLFDKPHELDSWLGEKSGSGQTWNQIFQKEVEQGVVQFVGERRTTPEGVIMQLLLDDIIKGATTNLQKNLGSSKIGPFEYDKNGEKKFNSKINSKERIKKAYNFAQTISQTNVSFVNGTRRQREKGEGDDQRPVTIPKGKGNDGDELLIRSKGTRRWIDIVSGYSSVQGWVGHSIDHMKTKVGNDLSKEARREASQAAQAENVEVRIKLRGGAIAHTLEALLLKFTTMQAAHLSAQGEDEKAINIDTDKALASAVSALPAELKQLNIDYTQLPKEMVDYFNQRKFQDEDFVGKSPTTANENPGVALLNKLMNDPHGVNIGGKQVTLQDLAKDDELYKRMVGYVDNLKSLGGDAKTQRAMATALNDLLKAVNRMRNTLGLSTSHPALSSGPLANREGQFRNITDQHALLSYLMLPTNQARLTADPNLRLAFTKQMQNMLNQGTMTSDIKKRIDFALAKLTKVQQEMAGTGVVSGTMKGKRYNQPDSQMWGVPGGLGVKSPAKGPIKKSKKK